MGRPGWGTCDLGAELHGARRSGWRELHDPEAVVEGKVGVEPPSEGGVERLGAVGISHGDDDRLELQTDSCATFRPAGFAILSVDGAHPGLLWSALVALSRQIGCLAPGSVPVPGAKSPQPSSFRRPVHGSMAGPSSFSPRTTRDSTTWETRTADRDPPPACGGQRLMPMLFPSV